MEKLAALIIDTTQTQEYIFSSNKLAMNVGASFIVKKTFNEILEKSIVGMKTDINSWKDTPNGKLFGGNEDYEVEIVFTGGGNSLILFKTGGLAKNFVNRFSKSLLTEAPGLNIAFGLLDNFDSNPDGFQQSMEELHNKLTQFKNQNRCNSSFRKHSIVAECPITGLSAEIWNKEENTYISYVGHKKKVASKESLKELQEKMEDVLRGKYTFTNQFDKLGQRKGERNDIAVIHIDGNNLSNYFRKCKSYQELRKLSKLVDETVILAFKSLVKAIIEAMEDPNKLSKANGYNFEYEEGRKILPIRPIILGGDDITFVTDGRLGVFSAYEFVSYLQKKDLFPDIPFTSCAGVAIIKTKYPFYRGYSLAKDLCNRGKEFTRGKQENSWLDFFISSSGTSGDVNSIIQSNYMTPDGNLHFGPYLVDDEKVEHEKNICHLLDGVKQFSNPKLYSNTRIHRLRNALSQGVHASNLYINELEGRGVKLPETKIRDYLGGWENDETPFYDMIELMRFYPIFLIS